MIGSALSVMLFIGIAIVVVFLRAERRAARNQDNVEVHDHRGGNGGFNVPPTPQPVNPIPPNSQPNPPQKLQPLTPMPLDPPGLKPGVTSTEPEGGFFANIDYRDYREDGAILIGFQVGLGKVPDTAVVTYLRPIWLTAKGEQFGTAYGRTKNPITTVKARDGYAIGGIRIKGGGAIEGICFTFMRRGEKHLIADDFYLSDWHGEQTRKPPQEDLRRGDGQFVIGIHGKRFNDKGGTEFNDSGCIGTIGLFLWVKP
ncbi:MAG: hypothetical protein L0241_15330 [Planctomycetia bacterium]|nr:hypothetical protein [Planctomycetia bacterium]